MFLDQPAFDEAGCYARNSDIHYAWYVEDITVDAYELVLYDSLDITDENVIYRGNQSRYTHNVESYNKTVYARLFAVNINGKSDCSEILTLTTGLGV